MPSDLSFAVGRADLNRSLRAVLERVAYGLDSTVEVIVVGHTDNIGSDANNDTLSQQRAQTVRDSLAACGVPADRTETAGRGAR